MAAKINARNCRWVQLLWLSGAGGCPHHIGGAVTTLEDAAFGDRPDLAVVATPAVPRVRWLAAVVLGAQGNYARAASLLTPLIHTNNDLGALAAATLASHRR